MRPHVALGGGVVYPCPYARDAAPFESEHQLVAVHGAASLSVGQLAVGTPQEGLEAEKGWWRQQIKEFESVRSTGEGTSQEAEPAVRVLYAEPLDLTCAFWQTYCHEARH